MEISEREQIGDIEYVRMDIGLVIERCREQRNVVQVVCEVSEGWVSGWSGD